MSAIPTNFVDNIGMFVNAAYLNNLGAEVNSNIYSRALVGTYASRPAAASTNSGALYFCTDTDALYRSDGTAWTKIRVAGAAGTDLADPPSGMTSFNLGTATIAADKGDRVLTIPSVAGDNIRGEYQTLTPTTNYTATAYLDLLASTVAQSVYSGLLIGDTSGKMISFGFSYSNTSGTGFSLVVYKWASASTAAGPYVNVLTGSPFGSLPRWLRIRDDGTNLNFEYSYNKQDWAAAFSVSRTDYLTPARIGWLAYNNSGGTAKLRMRSFAITTP